MSIVFFAHYVICNDSQQPLRFGQVGTDENIVLQPREMHQYGWRSHKVKQSLHLCLDCSKWKWCDPFQITVPGNIVRSVHSKDQNFTIIIKIKHLSNTVKQVIFTGQLVICNRLTQNLEVKLMTSNKDDSVNEATSVICSGQTMPSWIVELEDVREIKLRLPGLKTPWSQEIHVGGQKMKHKLIKIPLSNKSSYIHLWCNIFCQHFTNNTVQHLVLLTPLYVLRTHLPRPLFVDMESPKLNQQQELEVIGQAREYQLHCVGGDINHSLSFRLGAEMEKSNPLLILSTGLIDQVECSKVEKVDIDRICNNTMTDLSHSWPYCFQDSSLKSSESSPDMISTHPTDYFGAPQPTVELNVRLSEYLPGCKTLLVDITPESLVTNLSGVDLVVVANGMVWRINHKKTFTLPKLQNDEFKLGYEYGEEILKSASIPLSPDEVVTKLYSADIGHVLFIDGIVQVTINIPSVNQVLFLTLRSEVKHGMQIIIIREGYCLSNLTKIPLTAQLIALPLGSSKVNIPKEVQSQETIQSHKDLHSSSKENLQPLLFWSQFSTHEILSQTDNYRQFVHYVALKQDGQQATENQLDSLWSLPIRISANSEGVRHTLSIPNLLCNEFHGLPYCLTAQVKHGVTYLVLMEDQSSICVLYNNCPFPLYFGQTLMNIALSDMTVQEEAELIDKLPIIPPGGTTHYTMPALNAKYPLTDGTKYPRIHFCSLSNNVKDATIYSPWSLGVDILAGNTFIKLLTVADIKVEIEKKTSIIEVELEPVGKAEVSAQEIRRRLKDGNTDVQITETEKADAKSDLMSELKPLEKHRHQIIKHLTDVFVSCFIEHISLVILDQSSVLESVGEVLHLSMDHVFLATYPVTSQIHKSSVAVCIGNIQLDNQAYGTGKFDFPVILLPQECMEPETKDIENLSVIERHAILKSSSFVSFQIVLATNCLSHSAIETFDLALKPVSLFIDDGFIYRIIKEFELLLPSMLSTESCLPISCRLLDCDVRYTATALSQPIRIQQFSIQPINMLLSVHASLKLFLAADRTPLSFGRFEQKNMCTTTHHLIRALAMHYVSGAIFRAGIVIGSLEILGNPTGLVRSFSIGIADLVRLPYTGLRRGPQAFVLGVSNGMISLLRNVSTGMITSVTNLASSISRNMDRLSMDSAHLEYQEENRRNQPVGLSDGLKQGLTGFGLSVLGAVAGLADQPLQDVMSNQDSINEQTFSTSAVASGLLTGMGKGLVGIVTKPIGGAAELVSQTGQGILHGTGLGQLPQRLEKTITKSKSVFSNAVVKYPMKIFTSFPKTQFLMTVEARHLDITGSGGMVTLILTSEILFVVNNEEDTLQQAFSIRELECCGKMDDLSLISLIWTDNFFHVHSETNNSSNNDRVAAFVDSAATFNHYPINEQTPGTEDNSDDTSASSRMTALQYDFHVSPEYRNAFIALFNIIKQKILGRGFPLLY